MVNRERERERERENFAARKATLWEQPASRVLFQPSCLPREWFSLFGWIYQVTQEKCEWGGGLGRRADQVVSSNEPCQQCSAYKQIGLTDDTVAALVSVSPANHLSTPVFGLQEMCRSAEKAYRRLSSLSLSLSISVFVIPPLLFLSKTQTHTF